MNRISDIIIVLVCSLYMTACQNNKYMNQLIIAESFLPANPDSALTQINTIPKENLTSLEYSKFILIKTRIAARNTEKITWTEEMHQAALYFENNSYPLNKEEAATYYYFSGLAFDWNDQIPAAIVDWIRCAELLEDVEPCKRLFSTYENLYNKYSDQMVTAEYQQYAEKALNTARQINDSARIARSINYVSTAWTSTKSIDTTFILLNEAIKIAKTLQDSSLIAQSYNRMAMLMYQHKRWDEAEVYCDSALALKQKDNNHIITTKGLINKEKGKFDEAVDCLQKSYTSLNLSGKYWTSLYLFDISKQPGYEHLAHYGDSVIYYNQKFDHEEQSGDIEKAIADYKQQRQQEMYHQMIKSFAVAAVIVLMILGISYGWKTWRAKRRIDQLQMLLQEQKAKEISSTEPVDPAELLKQQKESLRLHRELFATTETYRRLQLLEEMKSGEVVNNQMREKLVNQVLAGFYDPIRSLMEGSQFSHEDLFLCLMFYMKFRTRDVAAVLGVSEDAIRKRKSRVRQRMEEVGVELFNEE